MSSEYEATVGQRVHVSMRCNDKLQDKRIGNRCKLNELPTAYNS